MRLGAVVGALAATVSLSVASLSVASLSGASPASAADMTVAPVYKSPTYIPAVFSWTGFYVGLSAGGGWGSATFNDPFSQLNGGNPRLKGFLIGGVTGTNYQIGSLVVGVEGDFTGSWAKGGVTDTAGNFLQTEIIWTSTVSARLGWAFDRFMPYIKAGGAFDQDRNTAGSVFGGSNVGGIYRAGFGIGAGAEYAVTEHWILRAAWDYMKMPLRNVTMTGNALTATGTLFGPANASTGFSLNQFKGIVEYKF